MCFDETIQTKTLKCCRNSMGEVQIFVKSNAKPKKVSVFVLQIKVWWVNIILTATVGASILQLLRTYEYPI